MLKRVVIFFLLSSLMFSTCAYARTVEFIIDEPKYALFDSYERATNELLAAPFIRNNRTMIPVRAVSESFGGLVEWDSDTRGVTISKDGKSVRLTIDSFSADVNGTQTELDAAPCIVNDTAFVPARFVTEALGYHVSFVPRTGSVLICDRENIMTVDDCTVTYPEYETLRYLLHLSDQNEEFADSYTKNYMLKNAVLLNAAEKAKVSLTEQQEYNINSAVELYSEDMPFAKGAFALLLENEERGVEYLNTVYNRTEIQNYYNDNYICAKHILISDGTEKENEAAAKKVYEHAVGNNDFDDLIEEFGNDPGTAANPDGYVFTKGDMIDSFETAAYSLKVDEISLPIKSVYGYHVIKRLSLPELSEEIANEIAFNLYVLPLIYNSVIK